MDERPLLDPMLLLSLAKGLSDPFLQLLGDLHGKELVASTLTSNMSRDGEMFTLHALAKPTMPDGRPRPISITISYHDGSAKFDAIEAERMAHPEKDLTPATNRDTIQ